jgi:hypothetical protein
MSSFAVLSVWALASLSVVPTSAQAAPTATGTPGAASLATYAATDAGGDISIGLTNATATPTTAPLGTPDSNPIVQSGNGDTPAPSPVAVSPVKATPPPTLADLLKQFPSLQPLIDSLKGKDLSKVDLSDLYKNMVDIFNKNGATGLAVFLKDSGLLDQLGIPLSYMDLLVAYDKGGLDNVQKLAKQRGLINSKNELVATLVLADVTAADQVVTDLATLGVNAYPPVDQDGLLSIGIPLDTLANFQSPDTLIKFFIAISQVKNVGGIKLQIPHAPAAHITNLPYFKGVGPSIVGATAWQKAGITGKGVRVGVLDMGFGGIKGLMNGKDLPTAAHLHTNLTIAELDAQDETHGTECAQVVHGAAPDAEMYVAFFDDSASFQAGLKYMLDNKVQILSYSIGSSVGPRDGTFGEALLVDQVVQKTDMLWVVAAGNEALDHTTFKYDDSVGDGQHHFDSSHDTLPFVAYAPSTQVSMNWNGSWKGGEKDEYDFSVLDKDGNEVASGAEAVKGRKNDLPFQLADFETTPGDTYYLAVRKNHAAQDNTIDIFINNAELPKWAQVPDHSVTVPADSSSAFTVGATVLNKTKIEPFSSEGPTLDGRVKPDITAPDGEVLPDNSEGFFGTSGATPLISGVAALVLQAYPKLTQSELRAYLLKNVTDLGAKGADSVFGAGQIKLPDPATINSAAGPNANSTPGPTSTPNPKATPRATKIPATPAPAKTAKPSAPTATATEPDASNNGGNTSSSGASATITDSSIKFGVVSSGVKGVQINVTFEVDGLKDGAAIVALQIFEADGTTPVAAAKANTVAGTLGTGKALTPGFDQTEYNNFPLFLPNSAFSQLSKGKHDLSYVITVLDFTDENNPAILIQSDPVPITVTK